MASFYDEIAANKRNSHILVFAVFATVFAVLYALTWLFLEGSEIGFFISALLAAIYISITYFFADSIVLSISGAREARKDEHPYLVNIIEALSVGAGIPMPKICVIDDPALNAFAVGSPKNSSVVFTTGLLSAMNRAELEGVSAHEISHIRNQDSRLAALTVAMIGAIAIASELGIRSMFWGRHGGSGGRGRENSALMLISLLIIIIAPIVAQLVRLALSRQREYLADASGAHLTRYPEGLASALEKIKKMGAAVKTANETTAPLYFANPVSIGQLFSTHPPLDERIKRLRAM